MLKTITKWNNWLGHRMFFVVLSALLIGFNLPLPKSPWLTLTAVVLFAYMTFVTALETSFKEVMKILHKPWIPLWMLFLIHVGTPTISWFVGLIFYPQDPLIRLGFLISAAIPVAVTSIIWTSLTGGSVPLALVTVTLDTLAVPIILPIFFLITVGEILSIDYFNLILRLLLMVTIPSVLGMLIHDLTQGRFDQFCHTVGGFTSKAALFLVILLNAAMVAPEIKWNTSLIKLLGVILLLVSCGYFLGFTGSFVLKDRKREIISAMIFNVGMRNIAFGSLLALSYFPPQAVIPVTLAMVFQQPVAAIVSILFRRHVGKAAEHLS
ncbi:MAG: bile acid:sodium symporter family protein [Bacillota bacterium]|jgi:predicted Na+-dependent transporter